MVFKYRFVVVHQRHFRTGIDEKLVIDARVVGIVNASSYQCSEYLDIWEQSLQESQGTNMYQSSIKTLPNIYGGVFSKNSKRYLASNLFRKKAPL